MTTRKDESSSSAAPDRRQFLTAGAAALVPLSLAGSPPATATIVPVVTPTSPLDATEYVALTSRHSGYAHAVLESADEPGFHTVDEGDKVEARPFVPLTEERRYLWLEAQWEPSFRHKRGVADLDERLDRHEELCAEFHERFPSPRNEFDLHGDCGAYGEFRDPGFEREEDSEPMTRSEGLAYVARRNAQQLELGEWRKCWLVLVEVGEPIAPQHGTITLHNSGTGEFERRQDFPIRLAHPTAAEIADFA